MVIKAGGVLCVAALLAACGVPQPRAPTHEPPGAARPGAPTPGAHPSAAPGAAYRIDAGRSELRLLVYRAGPLARLGHNHVIVNRTLSGWVQQDGAAAAGRFALQVPAAHFVVDDERDRAAEGADFSAPVDEDAKAGTKHNMLSAALLDAERYANITVEGVVPPPPAGAAAQAPGAAMEVSATLAVEAAGHHASLTVPFALRTSPGRLSVTGRAVLRQTDLGLTPFSAMLGALQVQDAVTVQFDLTALAVP